MQAIINPLRGSLPALKSEGHVTPIDG